MMIQIYVVTWRHFQTKDGIWLCYGVESKFIVSTIFINMGIDGHRSLYLSFFLLIGFIRCNK